MLLSLSRSVLLLSPNLALGRCATGFILSSVTVLLLKFDVEISRLNVLSKSRKGRHWTN